MNIISFIAGYSALFQTNILNATYTLAVSKLIYKIQCDKKHTDELTVRLAVYFLFY